MPKNNLDRLRYQVLQNNEIAINNFQIVTSDNAPTMLELEEKNFNLCYLYDNQANTKGWRHDGFRTSWDCKSHWSFPMRGKLKRKIDKIVLDPQRELHRWATQINHIQSGHTFVEYFLKTKGKPITFTNLQISYPEGGPSSPAGVEGGSSDSSPSGTPHNSPSPPSSPTNTPPQLRKASFSSSSSSSSTSVSSSSSSSSSSTSNSTAPTLSAPSSFVPPSTSTTTPTLSNSFSSFNQSSSSKSSTSTSSPTAPPSNTTPTSTSTSTSKVFLGDPALPSFNAPQSMMTHQHRALWSSVLDSKKPDFPDRRAGPGPGPFIPNRSALQPEMIRKGEHPLLNVQNPIVAPPLKGTSTPICPISCSQLDVISNWISQQPRTYRNIPSIYTSLKGSPDKTTVAPSTHAPNPSYPSQFYQNNDVKIVSVNNSQSVVPVSKAVSMTTSHVSNIDRMMADLLEYLPELEKLSPAAQQKIWANCCENTFFEAPISCFTPSFFRRVFEEWSKNVNQHTISIVIFHQTLKLFVSENQNAIPRTSIKTSPTRRITISEDVPQNPAKRQRKMEIETIVS